MNEASRDQLFRLLEDASRFEISERKRVGQMPARTVWLSFSWVGFFVVALFLYVLSVFFVDCDALRLGSRIFLLLSTLTALAAPVAIALYTLWSYRQPLKAVIRNPFIIPLWNAKITATTDARFLPLAIEQPLEDIEFVRLEVSTERENFERRVSLVIGTVEKIGVFPAILAALALLQAPTHPPSWVDSLPYALVAMYISGVVAHFQLMRLDRMLKLLDLAVVRKKVELEQFHAERG